jgi:hypothetical protein
MRIFGRDLSLRSRGAPGYSPGTTPRGSIRVPLNKSWRNLWRGEPAARQTSEISERQLSRPKAAIETIKHRLTGTGLIPAGLLFGSLVFYLKDFLSVLYTQHLAKAHKHDLKHPNDFVDLQSLSRQYLTRTGIVDAPLFILGLIALLTYSAPISAVAIGSLFVVRNFLANLILNDKNQTLLKFNDAFQNTEDPSDSNNQPTNNTENRPNNGPDNTTPHGADSGNNNNGDQNGNPNPGNGAGLPAGGAGPLNPGGGMPSNQGYGGANGLPNGYSGTSGLTGTNGYGGNGQPLVVINNDPSFKMAPVTRTG